ncbi:MAG: hemoglobin-like flavoprotein [Paraglaciecola sp.]|jgi:hemoglobin-like flavoprotein
MSITTQQKLLVQQSFKKVVPIADKAAEIFYAKLFEYDPSLKLLFKNSMAEQGKMLMATLTVAVKSLDDINGLVVVLQKLADRHVGYGVSIDDYTPVGNALLYALKMGLGDDFTPEVKNAWIEVYKTIAQVMRSHAYSGYNASTYKNTKSYG